MKRQTPLSTALLTAAAVAASTTLWAQSATSDGEVTKIDKTQAKITLRHGEIKNLDMPPMTMTFRVGDGKLLNGVSVGDRVRFAADRIGGNYTVTVLVKNP